MRLSDEQREELRTAVTLAASRPDVRLAIEVLYQQLQDAIDLRRPVCIASGRCCRFEEYGHRLFVTTAELAAFVHGFESSDRPPALDAAVYEWNGTGCPFQLAKLCGVHALRPFGCRIFFCDPAATQWQ